MTTKHITLAAALLAAPFMAVVAQPASAVTITGSYSISEIAGYGGTHAEPTVVDDGNRASSGEPYTLGSPLSSINLTVGGATTPATFFTLVPAGSCNSSCYSASKEYEAIDTINISITLNDSSGAATVTDSGTYTANYYNDTDSLDWTSQSLTVDFADGAIAQILLPDQNDWDINPTISFKLTTGQNPDPAPEPASLALLGTAMAGFGLMRRRRRSV